MEEKLNNQAKELDQQDDQLKIYKAENEHLQQKARSEMSMQAKNLESMSTVEAALRIKEIEFVDKQREYEYMMQQKNAQIKALTEKCEENDERYKEARQSEIELSIYKKKVTEFDENIKRVKFLENECKQLRNQNEILLNDHGKINEMQKKVDFHQKIALDTKKEFKVSQLENEKLKMKIEKLQNELSDMQRSLERSDTRVKLIESELLENKTKLSVYEQFESSNRLSSLQDDIEPELAKTKQLQRKCDDLQREVKILKEKNQSELSQRVIELEQKLSDAELEAKLRDQHVEMYEK